MPRIHRVLVQPLLVGVEAVNSTLDLGRRCPPLELELPGIHHRAEGGQGAGANVLAAVVQTSHEVGDVPKWIEYRNVS